MLLKMLNCLMGLSLFAERVLSFVLPNQDTFASLSTDKNPAVILEALRKAEVIPDVLNTFSPLVTTFANWSSSAHTSLGNTLPPSHLQHRPDILINKIPSAYLPDHIQLTLALTDPDAPSHDNPDWSQFCHWIVTVKEGEVEELVEYNPPGPPEGTGKHRYVFVVFVAANGTTEGLELSVPRERRHWGFEGRRSGVREWAKENGLKVIGANFIYAQNDKQ